MMSVVDSLRDQSLIACDDDLAACAARELNRQWLKT
jgi:hypothetical protein